MYFVRFTLQFIHFLAWPVVALGYPICASIRAIETGSKYHMRKLVIYWTIFSFISLFDKLIQWVPLWPHIKLITICWLVIPQFNGASYLYEILIHPCFLVKWHDSISQFNTSCYVYLRLLCLCLSVNLRTVADWFNKPMEDQPLKNETFLAVVEKYLEENGSDALEKLIANKYKDYSSNHHAEEIKPTDTCDEAGRLIPNQTECEGSGPVWENITVLEPMAKHEAAEPKQVKSVKENPIQIEKKTTGVQVKVMVVPADAEEIKLPEVTSSTEVQTEWTCAVCQMTTTSEQNMTSHLNGRKHKAKYEGLKTCKQTSKSDGSSPIPTKLNQLNLEQVKHAAAAQSEHSANEAAEPKQVKSEKENPIQIEEKMTGVQFKELVLPAVTEEIKLPEVTSSKKVQTEWTCELCQMTTTSEQNMKSHLNGRKHKAKCEGLKTCKQTSKSDGNSPVPTESNQLNLEQVKPAAAAQSEHSANETAEPKQVKSEKENPIQIEEKTTGVQFKELVLPAVAEEIKLPEVTSSKKVQTEWTCELCQMTTTSEQNMKSHLNGRKHKAKCEGLKTCKQMSKSDGNSPVPTESNQLNLEQVKPAAAAQSEHSANETAEPKQVKSEKENPIQIEEKTTGVQFKELVLPAVAEEIKLPEVTSSEKVQTEWTCKLCQMTTTSEQNMKSHLNGRKHKAKCEGLKTCKQTSKSDGNSPVPTESNQLNLEQVKPAAAAQSEHSANETAEPKQVKSEKENPIQIVEKTTGVQFKELVLPAVAEEIKLPEVTSSKKVQTEWTCELCQMTTTSEQNMKSHLNGRKHKAKCEGLKTCKQTSKSDGNSPVPTESNQLNLQQVNPAAAAQSEHSANETAEPKQVKSVKENPIQIEKKTTGVQIKETAFPADAKEIKLPETNSVKNIQTQWTCAVCQVTTTSEHDLKCHLLGRRHSEKCEELNTCKRMAETERNPPFTSNMPELKQEQVKHALAAQNKNSTNEKPKEKVQLGATTGQHQWQTQVMNAGGATHNSKLWCSFCDIWCPDEIVMAAHLNGWLHLAKLQERMNFTSGTWPLDYANMQFYQGF